MSLSSGISNAEFRAQKTERTRFYRRTCSFIARGRRSLPQGKVMRADPMQRQKYADCDRGCADMNDVRFFGQDHSRRRQNDRPDILRLTIIPNTENAPERYDHEKYQPCFMDRIAVVENETG